MEKAMKKYIVLVKSSSGKGGEFWNRFLKIFESIAGIPPFACFISELLIFIGAFQTIRSDNFYFVPTPLIFIAIVLSLAYVLRYLSHIFFGSRKFEKVKKTSFFMKVTMLVLAVTVIIIFMWPSFFINIISTFRPV
jgi:formate hydrogenlyase subunit 3/multisubunit Na+/H+ antiporter MnhD subunit